MPSPETPEAFLSVEELHAKLVGSLAAAETSAYTLFRRIDEAPEQSILEFKFESERVQGSAPLAKNQLFAALIKINDGRRPEELPDVFSLPRSAFAKIGLGGEPCHRRLDLWLSQADADWKTYTSPADIRVQLADPLIQIILHEPEPGVG